MIIAFALIMKSGQLFEFLMIKIAEHIICLMASSKVITNTESQPRIVLAIKEFLRYF